MRVTLAGGDGVMIFMPEFDTGIAGQLVQNRAITFDPDTGPDAGWKMNTHKRYPHAPRSPFRIDLAAPLRSVSPFRRKIARQIETILLYGSHLPFDYISDASYVITPLVAVLSDMMGTPMISPRFSDMMDSMISPRLQIVNHGLEEEIDGFWEAGKSVVIIGDVRTSNRELQEIVDLYRRHRLIVSACITVIDQSADEDCLVGDVPYIAVFKWTKLLGFYLYQRVVMPELHDRCLCYPAELQAYMNARNERRESSILT